MTTLVMEHTDQLRRIADLAGLDFGLLEQPAIQRWIDRRASVLDLTVSGYHQRLVSLESERRLLSEQIAVPESWINRYPASFELLRERATESLRGNERFRVVSLGCAAGQEPFTVAAVLADAGIPRHRIEIVAIDRSRSAIEAARSGLLPSMAIRDDVPTPWRTRFQSEGRGWRVDPELQAMVEFVEADIVTDPLPVAAASCDVVLCRNVLIYLAAPARRRLCARAAELMKPDGILLAGHADPPADLGNVLEPIDLPGVFAWRAISERGSDRRMADAAARPVRPFSSTPGPRPVPRIARPVREPDSPTAASVRRLADEGRVEEARIAGEALIERDPDDLETRLLLASIERDDGRIDSAREHLRRLLYLSPDHSAALLAMVSIAEAEGDLAAAARHRRRLDRADEDSGGASS